MRGKVAGCTQYCRSVGITPAYAGKSALEVASSVADWDHPRVCGEKTQISTPTGISTGSPPRMRGKVCVSLWLHTTAGITPAYAGKRILSGAATVKYWDHPRVCGEKFSSCRKPSSVPGSPPRMRGKGHRAGAARRRAGITPAYAGKRLFRSSGRPETWDHPRVCGEKRDQNLDDPVPEGSPPRMRGKVCVHDIAFDCHGITPAYAGKSTNGKHARIPR